jgi:hypothetical protein
MNPTVAKNSTNRKDGLISENGRQATDWEKILAKLMSDKILVSKCTKNS